MTRSKRSKMEPDVMILSEEDAMIIHRASRILEQQSELRRAAAERTDMPAGHPSQLQDQHALERWNRTQGLQNQSWNPGQSLAPSSYIPTPPGSRTSYDSQVCTGICLSSVPTSDPIVENMPDAYNDFHFDDLAEFDLQNSALGEMSSAMASTIPVNHGNLGILSDPYLLNMSGLESWSMLQMPQNTPIHQEHNERDETSLDFQMIRFEPAEEGSSRQSLHSASMSRNNSGSSEDRQNTSDSSSDSNGSGRQRRKPFPAKEREETGTTRELIACLRCRQQKIRCLTDYDHPHGTCRTCAAVVNQKMYKLPCLRYKVGDTLLFREGNAPSLSWSQRWNNMKMTDVVDWESPELKSIHVSHGFCHDTIKLDVRKFVPAENDVLERKWVDGPVRKTKRVEPYAIVNMTKAAQEVKRYVYANVQPCLLTFLEDRESLVRDTYMLAYKQSTQQPRDEEGSLLSNVLCLWFAIRHTTASEYLCGPETLGMTPEQKDRSYPLFGKIPIAPVMGAQLELIMTLVILRPLRKQVLNQLQKMIAANRQKSWFTIYLSCFILLHSCSLATAWLYKYSRRNGVKARYAMPSYIQELHQGANILLAHFHYCNKGSHPFSLKRSSVASMAELNGDQMQFLARTAEYFEACKEMSRKAKEYGFFEEEMYFVSQLFEEDWQPGPSV